MLDVVNTPETLAGIKAKHTRFKTRLEQIGHKYNLFSQVRGVGLLLGCVLTEAWVGKAKDVLNAAEKEGVMVLQAGPDVVRFAPSLVVEDADIDEGLDRFERAVATLTQG
ncbi:Succinylornithine transaminase/acetylornithine aminotransferase [compost metagenome]